MLVPIRNAAFALPWQYTCCSLMLPPHPRWVTRHQEDFDREAAAPPPAVPNSPAQQPGATASPAARPASAGASSSQNVCSGCGQPLASIFSFASGNVISAMGRKWHPQCFKCGGCKRPICEPVFSIKDNVVPYHPACFTNRCPSSSARAGNIRETTMNPHTFLTDDQRHYAPPPPPPPPSSGSTPSAPSATTSFLRGRTAASSTTRTATGDTSSAGAT